MIRNQWYAVLESKEVPKGTLIGVTRLGEKLVFWRNKNGKLICLKDKCAHRGARLSIGKICDKGDKVECPFHGLRYDKSGQCTLIPANGKNSPVPERFKVISYQTKEEHDFIWIWWGEPQSEYPLLPFFANMMLFIYPLSIIVQLVEDIKQLFMDLYWNLLRMGMSSFSGFIIKKMMERLDL